MSKGNPPRNSLPLETSLSSPEGKPTTARNKSRSEHPQSLSTNQPAYQPTYQPTYLPTYQPTNLPTHQPTNPPTHQPTNLQPTNLQPTSQPTNLQPTSQPTDRPANLPRSTCFSENFPTFVDFAFRPILVARSGGLGCVGFSGGWQRAWGGFRVDFSGWLVAGAEFSQLGLNHEAETRVCFFGGG